MWTHAQKTNVTCKFTTLKSWKTYTEADTIYNKQKLLLPLTTLKHLVNSNKTLLGWDWLSWSREMNCWRAKLVPPPTWEWKDYIVANEGGNLDSTQLEECRNVDRSVTLNPSAFSSLFDVLAYKCPAQASKSMSIPSCPLSWLLFLNAPMLWPIFYSSSHLFHSQDSNNCQLMYISLL